MHEEIGNVTVQLLIDFTWAFKMKLLIDRLSFLVWEEPSHGIILLNCKVTISKAWSLCSFL